MLAKYWKREVERQEGRRPAAAGLKKIRSSRRSCLP
jgi:hypothetical protein